MTCPGGADAGGNELCLLSSPCFAWGTPPLQARAACGDLAGGACSARPSLGIPGFNRQTSAARVELWAVQGSGVVDELGSSAPLGRHVSPFAPWEPSRSPASSSAVPCPRAPWVQPARQKKGGHVFLPSAPGPWAPSPQLLPGRPLSGSPSPWTFLPSPRGPCGGFSELLSLSPQLLPHLRQRPVLYVSASHAPCLRMRGSEDQSRRVLRWPRPQPSPQPLALLSPAEPTGGSYTCFTSK